MRSLLLPGACMAALLALAEPLQAQRLPIHSLESTVGGPIVSDDALRPEYFLGSLIASGFGTGAIALNANPGVWTPAKRWHAYLGLASGAAGIALAASEIGTDGNHRTLAAVNGIVGTASLTLGLRSLLTMGEARERMARQGVGIEVSPVVSTSSAGGMVNISF